jgi:hypothetical protein
MTETNLPAPMAFKRAPSLGVSTRHFGGLLTYLAAAAERGRAVAPRSASRNQD